MKKIVFILICLFATTTLFGQKVISNVEQDLDEVTVAPPKFTNIENYATVIKAERETLLNKFLREHFIYPDRASRDLIEGTEVIQFTVLPSGELANFSVINSVSKSIDQEMIRVLKLTDGMWKPGYNNTTPTEMEHEVSMVFSYQDEIDVQTHFLTQARNSFERAGIHLFEKQKVKRALRHYNLAANYLPYDKSTLIMRGLCHYELGNIESAKNDWNRVIRLGGTDMFEFTAMDISKLAGYQELLTMLNPNK